MEVIIRTKVRGAPEYYLCAKTYSQLGFASTEDGVTIDLSSINGVELQQATGVVSVGAGSRWQGVYDALDPYQLSVQGGRNGAVGVGGFLTGGDRSPAPSTHSCMTDFFFRRHKFFLHTERLGL